MDIAVLGAGLQGTLIALELADRGARVVLFDRQPDAICEASRFNEGKIHIGYIFAKDHIDRTARLMLRGAAAFAPVLSRWCASDILHKTASTPFHYLVMRDSLMSSDALSQQYARIDAMLTAELQHSDRNYLGHERIEPARELNDSEWQGQYNPQFVASVFATEERSVDLGYMATALRAAVRNHPRVETRWSTWIDSVSQGDAGTWQIHTDQGVDGPFDHVVNALWGDRLRVDATAGLQSTRPFLMRRKLATYCKVAGPVDQLNSCTMVLGPFGDVVIYPDGSSYLSWYPSGCFDRTDKVDLPADWARKPDAAQLAELADIAFRELDRRVPGISDMVAASDPPQLEPGVIFTWGKTDVDDPDSELHERHDVGPSTHWGTYHSVDTGKLSLAGLFALETADRILPT